MKNHSGAGCAARLATAALVLSVLTSCGSPTESTYPPITGTYGGQGAPGAPFNPPVQFDITYRTPDGSETKVNVPGTFIIVSQEGPQWRGEVSRYGFGPGAVTGEVSVDGAIQFTLTQPEWGDCATADVVPYSGYARSGGLYASGRGTVHCDDGTVLEVEEALHGRLPEPPPSP